MILAAILLLPIHWDNVISITRFGWLQVLLVNWIVAVVELLHKVIAKLISLASISKSSSSNIEIITFLIGDWL